MVMLSPYPATHLTFVMILAGVNGYVSNLHIHTASKMADSGGERKVSGT
jgi:hypothetical protein